MRRIVCGEGNVERSPVRPELQTAALEHSIYAQKYPKIERCAIFENFLILQLLCKVRYIRYIKADLDAVGLPAGDAAAAVRAVGEPALLATDHVEAVGEVAVLARHLARAVRVHAGRGQLHPDTWTNQSSAGHSVNQSGVSIDIV